MFSTEKLKGQEERGEEGRGRKREEGRGKREEERDRKEGWEGGRMDGREGGWMGGREEGGREEGRRKRVGRNRKKGGMMDGREGAGKKGGRMKEGRMEGRGGWKRTARMGQEERGEEGRLTESGTPHHRWWDARHPFVRSSVVVVVRASLRAYRRGWSGGGGVGACCSRGVGTRFRQWNGDGGGHWDLAVVVVCRARVVFRVTVDRRRPPACCVKKGEGRGDGLHCSPDRR